MKTLLFTVVLLFSIVESLSFAQSSIQTTSPVLQEHPLIKTMKLLNSGSHQTTAFKTNNENFQLNEIERQLWTGDDWSSFMKVEYIYEAGNRTERLEYLMMLPGTNWNLTTKYLFTYENNNVTSFTTQEIVDGEPIPEDRTLYSYQEVSGNIFLQEIEYQLWDVTEDAWIKEDRSTIIIENGVLSEVLNEIWIDDQWELYDRYHYEESGGNIIETTQMYDTTLEEWLNDEQYIYTDITLAELYDTLAEFIDFIDDGRSFLLLQILPDYVFYEWDDVEESWIAKERQITDVSLNLKNGATSAISIMIETQSRDTEEWIPDSEYILGYADNGNPVNLSFYTTDEMMEGAAGQMMIIYSENFSYDENNLLESILQYGLPSGDFFKQLNEELIVTGRIILRWGDISTSVESGTSPFTFRLSAAYPNPFNPSTVIPFQMATASDVNIQVFDMLGRNVATLVDEFRPAGNHTVRFDGSGLSSGVYMIRMVAPGLQQTRSVTLIK